MARPSVDELQTHPTWGITSKMNMKNNLLNFGLSNDEADALIAGLAKDGEYITPTLLVVSEEDVNDWMLDVMVEQELFGKQDADVLGDALDAPPEAIKALQDGNHHKLIHNLSLIHI